MTGILISVIKDINRLWEDQQHDHLDYAMAFI
jgi:hypothetical protein